MIDGYRQVNLRVSTIELLDKIRKAENLKSVDACVKSALAKAGVQ